MAHKCFISFKTEDMDYKKKIQEELDIDMIDKSLNESIDSDDEDYIMRKIREDYLADSTTVKEFSYNYYIPKENGCSWSEDERYCVLVKWKDFENDPETYIDNAFNKRSSEISKKTKVRP